MEVKMFELFKDAWRDYPYYKEQMEHDGFTVKENRLKYAIKTAIEVTTCESSAERAAESRGSK